MRAGRQLGQIRWDHESVGRVLAFLWARWETGGGFEQIWLGVRVFVQLPSGEQGWGVGARLQERSGSKLLHLSLLVEVGHRPNTQGGPCSSGAPLAEVHYLLRLLL